MIWVSLPFVHWFFLSFLSSVAEEVRDFVWMN
jgi:hypothetical protein